MTDHASNEGHGRRCKARWCRRHAVLSTDLCARHLQMQPPSSSCARCGFPGGAASMELIEKLAADRRADRVEARKETVAEVCKWLLMMSGAYKADGAIGTSAMLLELERSLRAGRLDVEERPR